MMHGPINIIYPYSCMILMKLESPRQIFEKYSNINFNENPSSGSRAVPGGNTDQRIGQTGTTKLIVAFRNFANAPRNIHVMKLHNITYKHISEQRAVTNKYTAS